MTQTRHATTRCWSVCEENLVAEPAADELIESILTDPDCVLCILGQLDTAAQVPHAAAR